jgi:vancomycin resistance protein YoaR
LPSFSRLSRWQVAGIVVVVLLAVPFVFPYGYSLFFYGRACPGVSIQGIPVGTLDQEAITTVVSARHTRFLRQPVTIVYGEQQWQPSSDQVGLTFDPVDVARQALEPGRRGTPIDRLAELWRLWMEGVDIAPRATVDLNRLQDYLLSLRHSVEYPPRDATLAIAEGEIIGTPSASGRQIVFDTTITEAITAMQHLMPQSIALHTRELPATIGTEDLAAAERRATTMISKTLLLTHEAREWRWGPDMLSLLVRAQPVDGELQVVVDERQLAHAIDVLADEVERDKQEPRLQMVAAGEAESGLQVAIAREGQVGWKLSHDIAMDVISTAIRGDQRLTEVVTVTLPVETIEPTITSDNLDELGIRELVAVGKSSFVASPSYRITNIKVGAARFDGVAIPPDTTFSFNEQLGPVDAEHGFVEGYAVIGNPTQLEWGGGVCQNSTTVFRAAFWAGLPIVERHAHPFYISWYDRFAYGDYGDGPGMDATIYTGVSDLKFVNDTGHWLLMDVEVNEEKQVLTVRLYGTKPDRTVSLEGPFITNKTPATQEPVYIDDPSKPRGYLAQTDVARSGRDITIYRVIEQVIEPHGATETIQRESFFTRFKPWPNVYVRGTGAPE